MSSRSIPFLSGAPAKVTRGGLNNLWSAARAMMRARTTRRLLAEMDGRMLADIGVSRTQAAMEVSRPFWEHEAR